MICLSKDNEHAKSFGTSNVPECQIDRQGTQIKHWQEGQIACVSVGSSGMTTSAEHRWFGQ